jgi:uncharacterized protein (TIGR03083 family)
MSEEGKRVRTDATAVQTIPPITRTEAQHLAATEYERFIDQLRALSDDDWRQPTDCPLWDVRALAGHSVGEMSDFSSFRSFFGRLRASSKQAKAEGGEMVDAMTAQQVAVNADLTTDQLIARAGEDAPRAVRWRGSANGMFRRVPMKETIGGKLETWRMAYLLDVILTRDPWMHRIDIARATGRDLVLTPDHDGRIVADVVAEWARRHGAPFTLTLTGPAGGEYIARDGGTDHITLDAIEFCRILSGRGQGSGLLAVPVPF